MSSVTSQLALRGLRSAAKGIIVGYQYLLEDLMSRWLAEAVAAWCAVLMLTLPVSTQAQEPSLAAVLDRASRYVTDFRAQLSGIVAEEAYEQWSRGPATAAPPGRFFGDEHRRLRSDFLLVRPEGQRDYYEFRDVFEVNGRPVRDRDERLTRLFLDQSASTAEQIRGIAKDSARYNIGDIARTLNTPTLALLILDPEYRPRFRFAPAAGFSPLLPLSPEHLPSEGDVWVIEYEETSPNTVIRGNNRSDLPAEGRFWIEPTTGGVLLSELVIDDPNVRATIDVAYRLDPVVGHLVPVEMRERYRNRRDGSRVDGTATYGRFRRFEVQVEESEPSRN